MKQLDRYAKPNDKRAWWEIATTLIPLILVFLGAFSLWREGEYLLALPLIPLCALLQVRLFVLQHDCGHCSFFKSRRMNNVVGFFLGILTYTPILNWRYSHNLHHATSGKLDSRGVGDIWIMTIEEYRRADFVQKMLYRIYRSPGFLFCLGPFFFFVVRRRFPIHVTRSMKRERRDVFLTDIALIASLAALIYATGTQVIPLLILISIATAGIGTWLFYIQHTFDDAYWKRGREWNYETAALEGSSFYDLPKWLHWFTANIGFHHIHHLDPRIPSYRLPTCMEENRELFKDVIVVRLSDTFRLINLRLWDEPNRRYVSFAEARC